MYNYQKEKEKLEKIINEGYEFKFSEYINIELDLFRQNIGSFISYTLVYAIILVGSSFIPVAGSFVGIVIGPPLLVGYYIVSKKIRKNEPFEFADFFLGFQLLAPLVIANLIISIFTIVGLLALIIPGIYLAVAYIFTHFFIVFHGYSFWEAMEASRRIITQKWWQFFGFTLVLALINLLGAIMFGVGLLITIPISYCAIYAAFEHIYGVDAQEEEKPDLSYFR